MRRISLSLACILINIITLYAQNALESGYYRVYNYGTNRYIYVTDNTGSYDMSRDIGDFGAMQLWKDAERTISDPASVIYAMKVSDDAYDIQGQNTGVYAFIHRYVNIKPVNSGAFKGTYTVGASAYGITKFLSDNELSSVADGTIGTGGNSPYRNWVAVPITASGDCYMGITPSLQHGGKYYFPFFAAFPFTLYSAGMKAYTITQVDADLKLAVLNELTGMIPANTPIIIECSSSQPSDNRLELMVSTKPAPEDNLLSGVLFCNRKRPKSKDAITPFDNKTMRVLGLTSEGKLGFVSSSDQLYNYKDVDYLPANQSYLPVSAGTTEELTIVTPEEYQQILDSRVFTLTYIVDGEVYEEVSLKPGEEITALEEPTKEGYTFSGWTEVPGTMPAENVTVTGSFTINSYTLTYVIDDEVYKTEKWEYHAAITPAEPPTREGYTFSGWDGLLRSMPAHDVIVKGRFTVNSYSLTYLVDGEVYEAQTVEYGSELTPIKEPEREGYTFSGWSEVPNTMPAGDVTIEGSFTINSYVITYMIDGEVIETQTVEYGFELTPIEEPEREGYTFSGWSEIPNTMPAGDVTIEGSFTINSYVITYMIDGEVFETQTVEYGSEIVPLTAPDREGYEFKGWTDLPESMPAYDVTVEGTYELVESIAGISAQKAKNQMIYDLSGRRVRAVKQKGLYIIDGKKILKK